jgi:hypothetical protein
MPMCPLLLASLALTCLAAPTLAAEPQNPQIDYKGFTTLAASLEDTREAHRLPYNEFIAHARQEGAILLDARSETAFAMGHIDGAVNLPLPDFTDAALLDVLGSDKTRPIYIYCNNNFSDDRPPIVTKRVELALNIATFINLHGYGYANVWELGGVMKTADVPWVENASVAMR